MNQLARTQLLLGTDAMKRLEQKKIAVFGIGGVGGYAVEALVRSGIRSFVLVDDDKICLTNLNRQIIATRKTVGKYKAEVMRRELKKRGVKKLKVVYSTETPTRPWEDMSISCRTHCVCPPGTEHKCTDRRDIPGSVAFVPSVAGLIIAGEVIRDLAKRGEKDVR
ncbi:tRNA threonylcarbamoyladenosine dehydratase [Parasporobacterium paucivorans]|uniref:ThiF family protein n=1 Tax=Parasporobacterium paucivorans DSM 15970 TaxID=1122934 RepID=A0A1M6E166_9FIRM|nr:ThiF family adenylyltransferase [Parasporobacterium paucivorans]SHI79110.1 ThiF family protein [Parasporobacterium paucivorans DSM 15970]